MGNILEKKRVILHCTKNGNEIKVNRIDNGSVRYGAYKMWVYKDGELYFKDSLENIYVKQLPDKVVISTRDNRNSFEVSKEEDEFIFSENDYLHENTN